jgi:ribonuclease E
MTKRMLIDASHAEETRVVVLDGNRLEDFDLETATKKQLKGNIYLAKVVRIEPSLQAAFVEYGGNRHGFLAFSEIHPDYYQIPVADRQRLLELQAEQARAEEEAEEAAAEAAGEVAPPRGESESAETHAEPYEEAAEPVAAAVTDAPAAGLEEVESPVVAAEIGEPESEAAGNGGAAQPARIAEDRISGGELIVSDEPIANDVIADVELDDSVSELDQEADSATSSEAEVSGRVTAVPLDAPAPETLGGESDGAEEARERRAPPRFLRNYKLQEVIRRRQIMLVQVVKEERGNKGAALTSYISLAGRYCVLMPNSPRGGGISRKITSPADRRRLKEVMAELDIPKGMGLIVRTAGANRPKSEIKRDCEYLLRLWDEIRETTMRSVAPALIYEEASLIKRAIRDVYSRDVDEVVVDGEEGWRGAHEFMRTLMPTHARKVILWNDRRQPLFAKHHVEAQLDAVMSPTVQLRSGGYLVINQTEALVAIDVNSGRSTRERGIEETALRTNLEAAEELARQLRLRDLAGLIVVDFIDMEHRRHNAMVERRLKEALKSDRARIQVGHISHFGLLEMSRQRLRPSIGETNFVICPNCGGIGHVRSTESAAIHVLRGIEEEAASRRASEIRVHVAGPIVMYILNFKRERLREIEQNYGLRITFEADDALIAPQMRIERLRPPLAIEPPAPQAASRPAPVLDREPEVDAEASGEADAVEEPAEAGEQHAAEEGDRRRRRRRRRRRTPQREDTAVMPEGAEQPDIAQPADRQQARSAAGWTAPSADSSTVESAATTAPATEPEQSADQARDDEGSPARRRGRRGGRRRRPDAIGETSPGTVESPRSYSGPTPADPFGGGAFEIFDAIEETEAAPVPAPSGLEPPLPLPETPPSIAFTPEPVTRPPAEAPVEEPTSHDAAPPPPATPVEPPEPAIKPFVIGADAPAAEKKRGWWRR